MNSEGSNQITQFQNWAEERLHNHLMEVNTKYGGENVETKDLLLQAFTAHRQIFEQELEEQKTKLAGDSNPWLGSELDKLKDTYVARLHYSEN